MAEKTVLVSQQSQKPIKITKWKVSEGNSMSIGRVILLYNFPGAVKPEQRKLKSTRAGTVHKLIGQEGAIIKPGEPLFELKACIHPTVMKDMCAECGADLRKDELVTTASVPMVHSIPDLKVSEELAQKLGKADGDRLLRDRKLVLLVDLDQTLIHTTNDNIPPNIKDVYHFQLYGPNSPWYHTRLRPGTHAFLKNVAPMFELHICTFGARNYAHTITMFLDSDQTFFSNRILSRDECFDPTSKKANLRALFPCGDNMVCIIDDREDVWNHALNLIHVKPYHFFQHTGDINAPPGLDKQENDDKEGVDLSKLKVKSKMKLNGNSKAAEETKVITNGGNEKSFEVEDIEMKEGIKDTDNCVNNSSMETSCDVTENNRITDSKDEDCKSIIEDNGRVVEKSNDNDDKGTTQAIKDEHVNNENVEANEDVSKIEKNKESTEKMDENVVDVSKIVKNTECTEKMVENVKAISKIVTNKESTEKNDKNVKINEDVSKIVTKSTEKNDENVKIIEDVSKIVTNKESTETNDENISKIVINKESLEKTKLADLKNEEIKPMEVVDDSKQIVSSKDDVVYSENCESIKDTKILPINKGGSIQNDVKESIDTKTVNEIEEKRPEDDLLEIEDPDDYLYHLEDILIRIHRKFYEEYDKLESGDVPDLKTVIPNVRSQILTGKKLVFSGLVPTHIKLEQSKAYKVAKSLGAVVTQDLDDDSTHLVAVRPGTAKVNGGRRKKNLKIVNPDWLWCCAERWEHVEESLYPLNSKGSKNRHPPPHCSSPEHAVGYPVHDTPGIRKRTPSGRFMDTINPLLSFSSDDIADMDKEVEDILDSSSDSEDEPIKVVKIPEIEEEPEEIEEDTLRPILNPIILDVDSSSSEDSLTGEYPRGFKRNRDERKKELIEEDLLESSMDEFPSTKFRRGEQLDSDLDIGQESNSEGSVDAPDEVDDGEWNMMGAALEREFLSNN